MATRQIHAKLNARSIYVIYTYSHMLEMHDRITFNFYQNCHVIVHNSFLPFMENCYSTKTCAAGQM